MKFDSLRKAFFLSVLLRLNINFIRRHPDLQENSAGQSSSCCTEPVAKVHNTFNCVLAGLAPHLHSKDECECTSTLFLGLLCS